MTVLPEQSITVNTPPDLLLYLESSTALCAVGVIDSDDGSLLWHRAERAETGFLHAERLHVLIEEALHAFSGSSWQAIAVGAGPGSYTGLRIGAASAKGLCMALGIPLVAVPTLESLAAGARLARAKEAPLRIFAAVDARRLEVYGAFFDADGRRQTPDEAWIFPDRAAGWGDQPLVVVGDGAKKLSEWMPAGSVCLGTLEPEAWLKGSAALAFSRWKDGQVESLERFSPNYLKEAAAKKASQSV
jgi:tRNA threonylcarbamoyladenosine biosynthesis protein TsaB